jgi:FkbM family methyltransferase
MELEQHSFRRFGTLHVPRGGRAQVDALADEVVEYFATGVSLSAGDVVVDVGANVGAFAIEAASRTPGLRLVCVEPAPPTLAALRANVASHPALREAQVTVLPCGLGSSPGEAEFHFFSRLPCDTTSHIEEKRRDFEQFFAAKGASAGGWLDRHRVPLVGGVARWAGRTAGTLVSTSAGEKVMDVALGRTAYRCPIRTLAEVAETEKLGEIALLKVDVEGAEIEVIEGVGDALWPRIRQVALEGHDRAGAADRARSLCERAGFAHIDLTFPEVAKERGLPNFVLVARR